MRFVVMVTPLDARAAGIAIPTAAVAKPIQSTRVVLMRYDLS
jgi:hypothetical protein